MSRASKRLIDIVASAAALLLLAVPMAVIGLIILLVDGRPILFRQTRPGYLGSAFVVLKFRTMTERRDAQGNRLADGQRLTRLGRMLRSLSLDELPQLVNVLKGEMSLVGPRPLLMQYLDRYTPEQARRHEVRPGITGWAQVNGRNALNWQQRFAMDVWYVDHCSLALDASILGRTASLASTHVRIASFHWREERGLTESEIETRAQSRHGPSGTGVGRVTQRFALAVDAHGERLGRMLGAREVNVQPSDLHLGAIADDAPIKCRLCAVGETGGGVTNGPRRVNGYGAGRPWDHVRGRSEETLDIAPVIDMVVGKDDCVHLIECEMPLQGGERARSRVHPHRGPGPLYEIAAASGVSAGITA